MAVPLDIRLINRRRMILAAQRLGEASRSQLARATALSQPTAGKIVDELLAEGILTSTEGPGVEPGRMGRPGQHVTLDGRRPRFVGVQVGIRHTRLAPMAVDPPRDDDWAVTLPMPSTGPDWAAGVAAAAKGLMGDRKPDAVVVSMPGVVDEAAGRSLLSPNLPWLVNADLAGHLTPIFGVPVHIVQEIRCLALGQLVVSPEERDFLLVDFGYGVGSAAVVNGSVYQGSLPLAGELGHTPVEGNRLRCGCRGIGCLETLISRQAITRAVLRSHSATQWEDVQKRLEAEGVEPPLGVALDAAGRVIAGALNVLGLSKVIITGSLYELPPAVLERLAVTIRAGAMWARFGDVTVVGAARHRIAGLATAAIDRVIAPAQTTDMGISVGA